METDSERLLEEGLATGAATFRDFVAASGWSSEAIHKTICHQVGGTHRRLMLQSLGLSPERDYVTYPWLGNTGSVALPITLAMAVESSFIHSDEHVALLGIGSGINCLMMGVDWQQVAATNAGPAAPHFAASASPPRVNRPITSASK
jgi:3-oxoacyl-[acyl-carrier-protein] synthase-3